MLHDRLTNLSLFVGDHVNVLFWTCWGNGSNKTCFLCPRGSRSLWRKILSTGRWHESWWRQVPEGKLEVVPGLTMALRTCNCV